MARYANEHYELDPGDFEVEEQEDGVALLPPDGEGALHITAFVTDSGDVTDEELEESSADGAPEETPREPVKCGAFRGFHARFEDDDGAWRVWWLAAGGVHLHVTWNGEPRDAGRHDAAVDAVLATLRERRRKKS